MPNAKVVQLRYDSSTNTIIAGTHGRGVFETIGVQSVGVQTQVVSTPEDTTFNKIVATFLVNGGGTQASDFSASIAWGDGNTSNASSIVDNGDGTYSIYGSHQYAEGGTYTFTVSVTDTSGGISANTGTAQVADLPINASPYPITQNTAEDTTYTGPVALFTDTDPDATTANQYQVKVSWYDPGSSSAVIESSTVTTDPNQPSGNHFVVSSSHLVKAGITRVVTTITGPGGSVATTETDINTEDSALTIDPSFQPASPSDGVPYTEEITQFTDADPIVQGPSNYTATVDWGDGSRSNSASGALVITKDTSGMLVVTPASGQGHVYDPGVYQMTVTVGNLTGPNTASQTYTLVVPDAALSGQAFHYTATAGMSFTKVLGTFTSADPRAMQVPPSTSTDPNTPPLSYYAATVDWGDGSGSQPATVMINFDGGFVVQGTHTYPTGGKDYTYTVDFKDVRMGDSPPVTPASASVTGTISVQAAPFSATATDLSQISLMEGQTFDGAVATITTPNTQADPTSFSATVGWGDGSTSPATITKNGTLSINGTHTYSHWGKYAITVQLSGPGSQFTSATNQLSIQDAPIQAQGSPISLESLTSVSSLKVASFTVTAPNATVQQSDYSAQIGWGDGSVTTGQITSNGQGGYDVLGSHTYAVSGSYPISVAINSQGGSNTSTSTLAQVSPKLETLTGEMAGSPTGTTTDTTPTFHGFAAPGAHVTLFVVPLSNPRFVPVGTVTADSITGAWSITTSALSDGTYAVTASAKAASGDPSSMMTQILPSASAGYLVIDTQGPKVESFQANPQTGVVQVTVSDVGGGLSYASLLNPANYSLSVATRRGTSVLPISGLTVVPQSATSVSSATLSFSGLPSRGSGTYVIQINAPGITDLAGNILEVTTYTPFPSIYNQPGQNFQAQFSTNGQQVTPLSLYVPYPELTAAQKFRRLINRRHPRA